MNIFLIILCAVSITYSVFLIARFGIKKKENSEFVSPIVSDEQDQNK